jgi:hypothetical protein
MRVFAGLALIGLGILAIVLAVILIVIGSVNARDAEWMIGTAVVLFIFGVLAIVGGFLLRKSGLSATSATADGRIGDYLPDVNESRYLDGLFFEVFYQTPVQGKNGRPSMLVVRLPLPAPATLSFKPESWWDRRGKGLGIAREHQTGDAEFDDAIYVRGPSEEYAAAFLADPLKRNAIVALVRSGFREVRLTGADVEAVWTGFDPNKHDRPGLADDAARALEALAGSLPADDPAYAAAGDRTWPWFILLWVLAGLFAASAACLYFFPPLRGWDLFLAALPTFALDYFLFGALAALLLRGTSISHDRWGLLMFWGLFLIGAGSFGSFAAVNALTDSAPLDERMVPVANRRMASGRHGKSYYAVVAAWDRPGESLEFSISSSEYDRIVVGRSRLHVFVGPGRFGIPWVKSHRLLP